MDSHHSLEHGWLEELGRFQPVLAEMLARNPEEQKRLSYFHTLREICQQPATWMHTAQLMQESARQISPLMEGISRPGTFRFGQFRVCRRLRADGFAKGTRR